MDRRTKMLAKLALSQVKMAFKTLEKLGLPFDRDKVPESDNLAYAKFYLGQCMSYLQVSLTPSPTIVEQCSLRDCTACGQYTDNFNLDPWHCDDCVSFHKATR